MKKLFRLNALAFLVSFIVGSALGQTNESMTKNLNWSYELPGHISTGPMDVMVHMEYNFVRVSFGQGWRVNLKYRITKMEFVNKFGTQRFKHQNQIYKQNEMIAADGLGSQGWQDINITSIVIGNMMVPNLTNNKSLTIESTFQTVTNIGSITKEDDLNHLILDPTLSYAKNMNWENSQNLIGRINKLNQLKTNRTQNQNLNNTNTGNDNNTFSETKTGTNNSSYHSSSNVSKNNTSSH